MRSCEIVPSLEEKHGGPSKSVYALSRALADLGETVTLFATHPSLAESRQEPGLLVRVFKRGWPQNICPSADLASALVNSDYDVVHHHSLWLRTLHYAAAAAKESGTPLVISPRGMMSDWAWNHHGWRKQIARHLLHAGAMESAAGWHATSSEEAADIRKRGFNQPICVAPNGVHAPDADRSSESKSHWDNLLPASASRRIALFYSRFHRKKRVLELIDLWLSQPRGNWLLLLVGLPGDYDAEQLRTYAKRGLASDSIQIFDGQTMPPPYSIASLFLLPSHSENFGLVVAEAMAHGVPVVVTDSTPWKEVNGQAAGWCVNWGDYPKALTAALSSTPEALQARGALAKAWVLTAFSWRTAAQTLQTFYQQLAQRRA